MASENGSKFTAETVTMVSKQNESDRPLSTVTTFSPHPQR